MSTETIGKIITIPCYNHGQFLQQALDSIDQQTCLPVEIIVVDGGSVDNTRGFVAESAPAIRLSDE